MTKKVVILNTVKDLKYKADSESCPFFCSRPGLLEGPKYDKIVKK